MSLLDTGTYQYYTDSFGIRRLIPGVVSKYLRRPNIFDFVMRERQELNSSNEVMIKDRILPQYIKGIIVSDTALLERLKNHLRTVGLIQSQPDRIETIFNIPVNQFIQTPSSDDPLS